MRAALVLALLLTTGAARADHVAVSEGEAKGARRPFPEADLTAVLQKVVGADGRVDPKALEAVDLAPLLAALAASSPRTEKDLYKGSSSKLAYFIDAYIVCALKGVQRLKPVVSVSDWDSFFDETTFQVGHERLSLHKLEADVMREALHDPRVPYVLWRGIVGGARLPKEAYGRGTADAQVDAAVRRFVADPRNLVFDKATKTVKLSKLFEHLRLELREPGKILGWINKYRDKGERLPLDAKIEYVELDTTFDGRR